MNDFESKKADDNFTLLTVADCRDADKGYCVYFEDAESIEIPDPRPQYFDGKRLRPSDSGYDPDLKMKVELTYWLPKSYNVIPRPAIRKEKISLAADVVRIYGKLGIANSGVYGMDIIREELEDGRVKKKTIMVFYDPEMLNKKAAAPEKQLSKEERIAQLKKELGDLQKDHGVTPASNSKTTSEGGPNKKKKVTV